MSLFTAYPLHGREEMAVRIDIGPNPDDPEEEETKLTKWAADNAPHGDATAAEKTETAPE